MFQLFGDSSLIELFDRADVRILLWLNHSAAAQPTIYKWALFLTDKGSELLVLATLLFVWFWPSQEETRTMFAAPDLSRVRPKRSGLREWLAGWAHEDEMEPVLTRTQSRAQVLLFGVGGVVAYITSRLIAMQLDANRPFGTYWDVKTPDNMPSVFEGLRHFGTFPSDHAAMLGALACSMFFWNRRLGWFWVFAGIILAMSRVAVGFHYPLDMIGGAFVGVCIVYPLLRAYRRRGKLFVRANAVASSFELTNDPYCYLMYFLVMLAGIEAAKHFEHVLELLFIIKYQIAAGLGGK